MIERYQENALGEKLEEAENKDIPEFQSLRIVDPENKNGKEGTACC